MSEAQKCINVLVGAMCIVCIIVGLGINGLMKKDRDRQVDICRTLLAPNDTGQPTLSHELCDFRRELIRGVHKR